MAPGTSVAPTRGMCTEEPFASTCPSLALMISLGVFGCNGIIGDIPDDVGDSRAAACTASQAGQVVARRLSREEYNNTVRDLFGLDVGRPADAFPDDVAGANGLTVSDQFLQDHEDAVARLATLAIDRGFITCDPAASGARTCAREILAPFIERAWRRPVTSEEVEGVLRYLDVVAAEPDEADPFRQAIELAIQAALMSPNFLFRFEPIDDPTSPASQPLGNYELANRLSYFIYESMPDEALFSAAAAGTLTDPEELEAQVERMLADPKAEEFADRLTREWLSTDRVDLLNPSHTLYPEFDRDLLQSMKQETALFVGEFLRDDRSFRDMFDAEFTYVDAPLARHYGLPGADTLSGDFARVSLAGVPERGGLLTQGAVLATTSVPRNDPTAEVNETNIIVRGKFVLSQLLCADLPPPPEGLDVAQIQADAQMGIPDTAPRRVREGVRQTMQPCAGCHSRMDPIGFSMEHYDVTGAWRTTDALGTTVDSTGVLLGDDGRSVGDFDGARSLGTLLKRDPRISYCLTQTVLRMAVGRSLNDADRCQVQQLAERSDADGNGLRALVLSITQSEAFTHQRGEAP